MKKPDNWDNIEPAPFGFPKIPAGGYILVVKHAGEIVTPKTRQEAIRLFMDVAEGKYKDYYQKLSEKLQHNVYLDHMQTTEGEKAMPYYKRLVNFFEQANSGFTFDFRPLSLVGKLIGAVCYEKEYLPNGKKNICTVLKVNYFCPLETIRNGEFNIPPKQTLEYVDPIEESMGRGYMPESSTAIPSSTYFK